MSLAQQIAAGTLSPNKETLLEGSKLLPVIKRIAEQIRVHGVNFAKERLRVDVSKGREHKLWLSEITVFLKHADRNFDDLLSADVLDNEKMLLATCAAYVELMKQTTQEIVAAGTSYM